MNDKKSAIKYKEGQRLLYEGSYKAILFNVIAALILALFLYNNGSPANVILPWLVALTSLIIVRMIHCKIVLTKELYLRSSAVHLNIFVFFTFLTGLAWSWIYFATLPYTNNLKQLVILLVFGGMSTGSTSSLGTYIPAFIAYISAIFVPVIIYYFSFLDVNKATIASIFMLFLFAITFIAKNFQGLLQNIFYLTEQNENLIQQLEELSITDPLTNLYNKRYFAKVISTEYNRSKRNKYPLAFVSFDVDNFKLINDNFGHTFGDKFLIYVAYYFKTYLRRSNDILFRLGGDEFTALLINATEEEVKYIAEQIQTQFLKKPSFDYQPQDDLHQNIFAHVTLSIGIVYIPYESTCSIETVIEEADKLLYQAKHEGKNQIKYSKI